MTSTPKPKFDMPQLGMTGGASPAAKVDDEARKFDTMLEAYTRIETELHRYPQKISSAIVKALVKRFIVS